MKCIKRLVIEKEKLLHNLSVIKKQTGNALLYAVLKGNAYGLGDVETAKFLEENGVEHFAVSRVEEGVSLRKNGVTAEILTLCSTAIDREAEDILEYRLTATVGSFAALELLNRKSSEKNIVSSVHLKFDTGFGRYGFLPEELSELVTALSKTNNIIISGVFTHLSDAFGKKTAHSEKQFALFDRCVKYLHDSGIHTGIRHVLNSNGIFRFKDRCYDGVRVGSALTGRVLCGKGLRPVGSLEVTVQEVKKLPKGANVGYGNACKLKRDTLVAILPVGTADGIGLEKSRGLYRLVDRLRYVKEDLLLSSSRRICGSINGKKAYILGRPCMTSLMLDVTGLDCKPGDICTFSVNPMFINADIERKL